MFDTYSTSRENARFVVALHPELQPTWPDMVRQRCDADMVPVPHGIEARLYRAFSESPLSIFVTGIPARLRRWLPNSWRRPARRVYGHYLPLKRHSPVHR